MKLNIKIFHTFLCTVIIHSFTYSQSEKFFPKKELMQIGAYYYPDQWPESQWERDLKRMAELGFQFTHVGEFAWNTMEPEEGIYNFAWLDRVLALADKYHIKVILCTPTCTPPAWMATKYPEIFIQTEDYISKEHGSRANGARSSKVFLDYTAKITLELAKRYGKDQRVIGWQLDNEPEAKEDYSPAAQARFKLWLKNKYNTLEALNKAWGLQFWNAQYSAWDQVRIPNGKLLGYFGSQHSFLDFRRFSADEEADFLDLQADILHKNVSPTQWVTTNFVGRDSEPDKYRVDKLDFLSYTMYPLGGQKYMGEYGFRIGSQDPISFSNDFYRPIRGAYGVMELQPGQVNWGAINPQPFPGTVRMWLWHVFAGGSSFTCTYRLRQPLWGNEHYHAGIVKTDGTTLSQGGSEFVKVLQEMSELKKIYDPKITLPKELAEKKTGFLWNQENIWELQRMPQTKQFVAWDHVFRYQRAIKSAVAPLDYIPESANFNAYKVLVAPAYTLVDKPLIDKLTQYVQQGGHLVLSCRTAQMDRAGQLWEGKWAAPIVDLIGAEIPFYDVLLEDTKAKINLDNMIYEWNNWGDVLETKEGTEVWATYNDQYYRGKAAVTHRKVGKGTVTYVGADSDDGRLEKAVMQKVYQVAGGKPESLPEGVYKEWRDGYWVAVNYSSVPYQLKLNPEAKILFGTSMLESPGVTVWK